MELKIKEDAGDIFLHNYYKDLSPHVSAIATVRDFADKITAIQGMTIEVETKYLWDNQFNTVPIEGISEKGLRILDFKDDVSLIEEIIEDIRPFRTKCPKCFHYLREDDNEEDPCWWCGK